jgi:hypothetical protein
MNRATLLKILPPAEGKEEMIVDKQTVRDIVKEVLNAHDKFAPMYDRIASQFEGPDCESKLFEFCKDNLRNDTEDEDLQTTTSPTVLLEKGHCDCKGYAGFIGGILDALNRGGGNYKWCSRFAEYEYNNETHYHVFIVVKEDGEEIWIDPVLQYLNARDPYPDKYFDRKKSTMTLVRMSGVNYAGSPAPGPGAGVGGHFSDPLAGYIGFTSPLAGGVSRPVPQLTPAGTALTAANVAAATAITATGGVGLLAFKESGQGLLLPSIPGYPPDLPQLQLSPAGRLCFYTWPLVLTNPVWLDFRNGDKPIAPPGFSTLDWDNTYLRIGTSEKITKDQFLQLRADFANGIDPFDFAMESTAPGHPSGYYKEGHPYHWIFANVQYYIDRYLKNPYGVNALISYGTNWCDQFKAAIYGGQNKFKTYLEGCNFLVQPEGHQGFWDKFYLAAPLIISAAAAIMTAGAATPALALAIANLAVKAGEANAAKTAAQTLVPQGAPVLNTSNLTTDIQTIQGGSATGAGTGISASAIMAWIQANPLPAAGIAGALLLIIYGLSKD